MVLDIVSVSYFESKSDRVRCPIHRTRGHMDTSSKFMGKYVDVRI